MIRTICPNCKSRLKGPDTYTGKTPKCPACKTPVPPPAPAKAEPRRDVPAEVPKPKPEKPKRKARPAAKHKPSRGRNLPWRNIIATSVAALVVIAAIVYVIAHVRKVGRLRQINSVYSEIRDPLSAILQLVKKADALVEPEDAEQEQYAEAKEIYEDASNQAQELREEVRPKIEDLGKDAGAEKVFKAADELDNTLARIEKALKSDEIQLGSQGFKLDGTTGEWVPKEEWYRRKGYIERNGEWFAPDEFYESLGYVERDGIWSAPEEAERVTIDDFEGENAWVRERWANDVRLVVVMRDDNRRLRMSLQPGDKKYWACGRKLNLDLTSFDALQIDVFNEMNSEIKLAIAFITDDYYESQAIPIPPDISSGITFRIRTSDFKSPSTDWKHTTSVKRLDKVESLVLVVYAEGEGTVRVDNIRAIRSP